MVRWYAVQGSNLWGDTLEPLILQGLELLRFFGGHKVVSKRPISTLVCPVFCTLYGPPFLTPRSLKFRQPDHPDSVSSFGFEDAICLPCSTPRNPRLGYYLGLGDDANPGSPGETEQALGVYWRYDTGLY